MPEMKYKIVVDHWGDVKLPPIPTRWFANSTAWEGDDAGIAGAIYAACCQTLKAGGCYRSNIGVFFYTDGEITDRYLIEDGRYVSLNDLTKRAKDYPNE